MPSRPTPFSNQIPHLSSAPPDILVKLDILQSDIDEMDYHLNECPMSNMATDNAVAYALRRILKPGLRIAVSARGGKTIAKIDGREIALADEVAPWLGKILMGINPGPLSTNLRLPEFLVRRKVAVASRRAESKRQSRLSTSEGKSGHAA